MVQRLQKKNSNTKHIKHSNSTSSNLAKARLRRQVHFIRYIGLSITSCIEIGSNYFKKGLKCNHSRAKRLIVLCLLIENYSSNELRIVGVWKTTGFLNRVTHSAKFLSRVDKYLVTDKSLKAKTLKLPLVFGQKYPKQTESKHWI